MNLFPLNKNSIALILVALLTVSFFICGMLDVLDYFIIKSLLFVGFGGLLFLAIYFGYKNGSKKNRPEDKLQDDSH
jgi:hypothetical protein